jgi:hypothetical protein
MRRIKSGMSATKEYRAWRAILNRVYKIKDPAYENYGGRGIKVCQSWRESVNVFYEDLGKKPSERHTIDRIDNNGNYSCGKCDECVSNNWPLNVRWATRQQQALNTRLRKNNTSGYRGVNFWEGSWVAQIRHQGKQYYLGRFKNPKDAAKAYNDTAIKYWGDDAPLNEII